MPSRPVEAAGDPRHLVMFSLTLREIIQLARQIAPIKSGKTRRKIAIPFAIKTVARNASTTYARITAAQGYKLASLLEPVLPRFNYITTGQKIGGRNNQIKNSIRHIGKTRLIGHIILTMEQAGKKRRGRMIGLNMAMILSTALFACKQPPDSRYIPDTIATEQGLAMMREVGCAACHEIPGIAWPEGRTGPSLVGFDDIGPIAGTLPNTPENLAFFVRNAPLAKPGSTMPAMPLTEEEARDVAAYLYIIDDE